MHVHLKSLLAKAGCDPDATDDGFQSFYDGLAEDKKVKVNAKLAKMSEGGDDDDEAALSANGGTATPPATPAATGLSAAVLQTAITAALSAAGIGAASSAQPVVQRTAVSDDDVALTLETQRVDRVRKLATLHKISDDVTNSIVAEGGTFEQARLQILKKVSENCKPVTGLRVGDDKAVSSMTAALSQAMLLRSGMKKEVFAKHNEKLHERSVELSALPIKAMLQRYYAALGFNEVYEFSDGKLAEILGPRGLRKHLPKVAALAETTSDFPGIMIDAQNKSLRFFYLDAKRTWPIWSEQKFNVDFKPINRIVLSEAPNMQSRNEGGELKYVQLKDSKEVYSLVEYAEGIRLSRRAFINDSMDAFTSIPRLHANAASRLEDDVSYAALTNNPAMTADNVPLFNTAHSNYVAGGSGSAPSISSLQTMATMMYKQKGLAGAARLELEPKFLLVPSSIVEQTRELIISQKLIAGQTTSGNGPTVIGDTNPFFNRYTVVGSSRLDDISPTAWYLLADYREGQINTVETCFLTDEPEPVIKQETDFDTEDLKMMCRHTVAAHAIDYRGMTLNAGA